MNPQYSRYYHYIKPLIRNRTVRTYSSVIFSLITITIFGLFAIKPTLATIVSLQKSIAEQQHILDALNNKSLNLAQGRKNYDNLDPQAIAKLNNLLPNSTSLPSLIASLESLAQLHQASISGLQFQPTELVGQPTTLAKNASLKEIDFTLNVHGSFSQLTNFLQALEKTRRLITISSVNFGKSEGGPLVLSINAKAYYLKN